eukprot:gene6143-10150_t
MDFPANRKHKERSPKDLTEDFEIASYMILKEIKVQLGSIKDVILPTKRVHAALLIVINIETARKVKEIAKKYLEIDAICYHSKLPNYEQRILKNTFENGKVQLMIIVQSLLEGYDYPPVSILGITRKIGKNIPSFDQFVGRALRYDRTKDGEKDELIAKVITHQCFYQQENIKF